MDGVGLRQRRSASRTASPRTLASLFVALAMGISSCTAISPSALDSPSGLVAPSGVILEPPCPASAACSDGFVVDDKIYGISCHGVEPAAVGDETLARGAGTYEEARAIEGIPPNLWLAVRGELPCQPGTGEPLRYEWYLAAAERTQADIEEWGRHVADVTLPLSPDPSSDATR